jgi:Holliday junction resolvase RusA-like endonuclease
VNRRILFDATVPGAPVGKGSPRTSQARGKTRTYYDEDTVEWMGRATQLFALVRGGRPRIDEPVIAELVIVKARPEDRPDLVPAEWWARGCRVPAPVKPDYDNVEKAVYDSAKKAGVLREDSRIVGHTERSRKFYAAVGERPFVRLRLISYDWSELEGEPDIEQVLAARRAGERSDALTRGKP